MTGSISPVPVADGRPARSRAWSSATSCSATRALRLATALAVGRTRPEQWEEDWAIRGAELRCRRRSRARARRRPPRPPGSPRSRRPISAIWRLKSALALYRELARGGNWPQDPERADAQARHDRRARRRRFAAASSPRAISRWRRPSATETSIAVLDSNAGVASSGAQRHRRRRLGRRAHPRGDERPVAPARRADRPQPRALASLPRDFGKNYVFVNVPGRVARGLRGRRAGDVDERRRRRSRPSDAGGAEPHRRRDLQPDLAHPALDRKQRDRAEDQGAIRSYLEKNQMVMKGGRAFRAAPRPEESARPRSSSRRRTNSTSISTTRRSRDASSARRARLSHGCVRMAGRARPRRLCARRGRSGRPTRSRARSTPARRSTPT